MCLDISVWLGQFWRHNILASLMEVVRMSKSWCLLRAWDCLSTNSVSPPAVGIKLFLSFYSAVWSLTWLMEPDREQVPATCSKWPNRIRGGGGRQNPPNKTQTSQKSPLPKKYTCLATEEITWFLLQIPEVSHWRACICHCPLEIFLDQTGGHVLWHCKIVST